MEDFSFLNEFTEEMHSNLVKGTSKIALAYLVSRHINIDEIRKHKIGFIGNVSKNFPQSTKESRHFNKWMGSNGKYIKQRLTFPIYDEMGNIRGIETRALDKRSMKILKPKFKQNYKSIIDRLPDTEVRYRKFYFEKNKFLATFFGLPHNLEVIWNTREVFLTEGILDFISISKAVPNCLSSLTANLSEYQINWLKRYVDKIVFCFDSDKKGKQALYKLEKALGDHMQIVSLNFKGLDVNQFLMNYGEKDLKYFVEEKINSIF